MQKYMQSKTGLPTFVAAVGPVSSNRERAVELYAQIRGQRADYGHVRSSTWGFSQLAPLGTSMDFSSSSNPTLTANVKIVSGLPYPGQTGYMPNFCTKGNTDIINLVGHSLGGPTIRMFERLIQQGDATEMAWCVANGVKCNDLYNVSTRPQAAGQVTCIRTMTTMATLHDGSPLHSALGAGLTNAIKSIILNIQTGLTGLSWFTSAFGFGTTASLYNFDLDRLGGAFAFNSGVGFTTYVNTVFSPSSPLNNNTYYATAAYDLSPEFMLSFNNGGPAAYTTTKYFAASSGRTTTCGNVGTSCGVWPWTYHQCPWTATMEGLLQPTSSIIGELTGGSVSFLCWNNGQVHGAYTTSLTFTSDSEENDGLVTRKGGRGPNTNAPTPQPVPGTKPYLIGCGGYVNSGGSCSSTSNTQSDKANWAGMASGQWYFIDYSYDHVQMIGLFISSWGSSALAYGLPDGRLAFFCRAKARTVELTLPSSTALAAFSDWARSPQAKAKCTATLPRLSTWRAVVRQHRTRPTTKLWPRAPLSAAAWAAPLWLSPWLPLCTSAATAGVKRLGRLSWTRRLSCWPWPSRPTLASALSPSFVSRCVCHRGRKASTTAAAPCARAPPRRRPSPATSRRPWPTARCTRPIRRLASTPQRTLPPTFSSSRTGRPHTVPACLQTHFKVSFSRLFLFVHRGWGGGARVSYSISFLTSSSYYHPRFMLSSQSVAVATGNGVIANANA